MESKVFSLDQTNIKKLLTAYRLKIPDFQREFVWKKGKKEQLLESLFRGFPIGALTLYEDKEVYYIIDGLQRVNTLNQYLSKPSTIVSFEKFWNKVSMQIEEYIEKKDELHVTAKALKKYIKKWYEELNSLYAFEKVSILYNIFANADGKIGTELKDLQIVEELLEILRAKIEIAHDDIALIIYKGDKEDLPDLFKNINTGSVALSQYEILQSVWNDYILDKNILHETYEAFSRELDLIQSDYEITAVKEEGQFDVFKNIIGLNHLICCKEDSNVLFRFPAFKSEKKSSPEWNGIERHYTNDSIGFEIYSTMICHASNKIVTAVDMIFRGREQDERISAFIAQLNNAVIDSVNIAISELENKQQKMLESKYHSLYVLAGVFFSKYDIDVENLRVDEGRFSQKIFDECLDLERQTKERWFVDENRQISFFNNKIKTLYEMK